MSESLVSLVEMTFVYGVIFAIAIAIWQLVSVRREIRRDKERAARTARSDEAQS